MLTAKQRGGPLSQSTNTIAGWSATALRCREPFGSAYTEADIDPENWLISDAKLYVFGKPAPAGPALFQKDLAENVVKSKGNRGILPKQELTAAAGLCHGEAGLAHSLAQMFEIG